MVRRIYDDLKPELARVAGVSGMDVSDARVMAYTNLATEELVNEGDWPQLICRMRFKTSNCRINVPSEFDRIISLNINGVPQPLQSPWFEFVGYGPNWPATAAAALNTLDTGLLGRLEGVLDQQEVATFEDIPSDGSSYYPTVFANVNETVNGIRPVMTIQGYNQNGQWVRSQNTSGDWIDGIQLAINGDTLPYAVTSPVAFSVITAIFKPVTNGHLSIYVNGTQQNVFIGSYAPYDTKPFYRRYAIPNLADGQTYCILARLRKRYTPIVSGNDLLLIPNLPALSMMVQAVYYREAGDVEKYGNYKGMAIDLLKKEMVAYIGKARQKPLITVSEGLGVRRDGVYVL